MKRYFSTTFGLLALAACSTNKPAEDASSSYAEMEPASATSAASADTPALDDTTRPDTADTDVETRNESASPAPSGVSEKANTRTDDPPAVAPAAANAGPDNTKKNQRDTKDSAVTPLDQGNNETDLKITQKIRQAVMDDGSLSFNAKNVKIITVGGKVTLRGPVNSTEERSAIEAASRRVAGVTSVDNQLEVKK